MAPELLLGASGGGYTTACDVYSFAILANEVLTQTVPYSDALTEKVQLHTILEARYNHDSLTAEISQGLRPAQPTEPTEPAVPAALLELVRRCWAQEAAERPAAAEACAALAPLCAAAGTSDTARQLFETDEAQLPPDEALLPPDEAQLPTAAPTAATAATAEAALSATPSREGAAATTVKPSEAAAALASLVGAEGLPARKAGFELSAVRSHSFVASQALKPCPLPFADGRDSAPPLFSGQAWRRPHGRPSRAHQLWWRHPRRCV